jgi:CheY-like chemotaxis protein
VEAAARRKRRAESAPELSANSSGKRTAVQPPLILVVDDVDDNREIYCSYLAKQGYRVAEASDGAQAVVQVVELAPRVVVMDLAMPVVDGWEATRRIRTLPAGSGVHIIVLSGHVTRESREQAFAAGCDEFIAKPCLPGDLARRIAEALGDDDWLAG